MQTTVRTLASNRNFTLSFLMLFAFISIGGQSWGQVARWNFFNQSSPATSTATATDANVTVSALTRGSTAAAANSASNSFRTTGFGNDGISTTNTDYFQFTIKANTGYSLSLSSIASRFNGTTSYFISPGVTSQYAYSLDGTNFTLVTPASTVTSSTIAYTTTLSSITALQSLPTTTTVYIRYYASGQTSTGGWGYYSADATTANDGLSVTGTVATSGTTYTITSSAGTGGSISPNGSTTVASGASQTYTITPATGYQIATVQVDGTNNTTAVSSGSYTFSNVTADHTISATFSPLAPAITSISPTSAVAGTASQTVTITGSNFISGVTTATYNNVSHTVTYISSTQISILLSSSDLSTIGSYPVVVTNTGNATTATTSFAVTSPAPTITSLSPSQVVVNSGAQTLTINGTNFISGTTTATYGSTTKTVTYVSATQITIPLLASDVSTLGSYAVVVTNTGNSTSATATFYVTPANDLCGNATALTVGAAAISGTTVGATTTSPFTSPDVWYSFTAPTSGTIQVTIATSAQNINQTPYSGGCPTSATTTVSYSPTTSSTSVTTDVIYVTVIAGTTYYLREEYSTTNSTSQGSFTIQAAYLQVPVVTSNTGLTGMVNSAFSYQITATNSPTSYAIASGTLPSGLTLATSTGVISGTPTASGTYTVTVTATNQAGTSAPATLTFTISAIAQTITFNTIPTKLSSDTLFTSGATASSGLTVTYTSSNTAVATISNDTIQIRGIGTAIIKASQAGSSKYSAAPDVQQTLTVVKGSDLLAGWDFQTTTNGGLQVAQYSSTQKVFPANFGSGIIYLNGTNGSSTWYNGDDGATSSTTELNGFTGAPNNAVYGFNTFAGTGSIAGALALLNGNPTINGSTNVTNGKSMAFKVDMSTHKNLVISYATQRTNSGFTTHTWQYSTDGTTWTNAQAVSSLPSSFGTLTLDTIRALNYAATAYVRVTLTGATQATSNNRFDNIRLNAVSGTIPVITTQPANVTPYCAGTATTSTFTVVATGDPTPTYQWQYSTDSISFNNVTNNTPAGFTYTNATTATLTVQTSATAAGGKYFYRSIVTNIVGSTNSTGATLTINALPTATISGPSSAVCAGSASGVTITNTGTTTETINYTTQISGGTAMPNSIILTSGSGYQPNDVVNSTTTYTITSISNGTCTSSSPSNASVTVTVNPAPVVAAIVGPDYIALGKTGTYTDGTTGGTWAITNDPASSASIQTQSGNPATTRVKASTTAVGTPTLTYTVTDGTSGCSTTVSKTINIFDNAIARYRSAQDGKASDASTWEVLDDNNTYVPATTPPDNNSNIEVRHRVRLETAVFNGSSTSSFKITSHDSSGVTINGKLTIYPTQYFQSNGSVNFNGDSVILLSSSAGTGSIGVMGAAISGATNVTVQRYTDGKKSTDATGSRRAWRLITSPVTGQTIRQSWQEGGVSTNGYGTLITGEQLDPATAAAQGYDYIGGGNHTSLKHYVIGGDPSGTGGNYWLPLSNTGSTTGTLIPIQNEQAYLLFVRGDRTVGLTGTSPATLRSTGSLQQGDGHAVALTPNSLYTLVGNPYASAIDFGTFIGHNSNAATGIQDKYYSWNSTIGTYGSYVLVDHLGTGGNYEATPVPLTNGSVQQNDNYRFITNGSGFFVLPNSPTTGGSATSPGSVSFKETDKAPGMVPPISPFRVVTPANERQLLVNLSQKDSDTSLNLADGFRARFSDEYSGNEADNSTAKAANPSENLGLVRSRAAGESDLIIEARADVQKTDTLYMKMWNVSQRSYQLQVQAAGFTTAPGVQAWLQDSYLGTKQAVELAGGVTSMDFTVTADSGSWRSDRFMIVFTNSSLTLPVTVTNVKAAAQNGGVSVAWTVTNETNIRTYQAEKSADGGITFTAVGTPQAARNNAGAAMTSYSSFDNQAAAGDNLYRIRIEAKDGTVSYSQTVKVTVGGSGTGVQIVLYPNPVRQGRVSVQLTNLAAGTYLVSVYTSGGGQAVYQKKVTITQAGTTQSEELLLGSTVAQGSYEVKITNHNGAVVHQQQLIVGR